MIKLKYNFKQWHIFAISEFFKNVDVVQDRVNEVYYNILESNIETGRGRILQTIAVDNIIGKMNLENICSIKEAFNYSKQDENTIIHIADVIIKYESKFYSDILNYYNEVCSIMKKLLANCYSNFEKNKIILYLIDVGLKWLNRIIKEHSLPGSTKLKRKIESEYDRPFYKLLEAVSICLQKELKIIMSNSEFGTVEFLIKYIILFREMHKIMPTYGVEIKVPIEAKFREKENKEKSKL